MLQSQTRCDLSGGNVEHGEGRLSDDIDEM